MSQPLLRRMLLSAALLVSVWAAWQVGRVEEPSHTVAPRVKALNYQGGKKLNDDNGVDPFSLARSPGLPDRRDPATGVRDLFALPAGSKRLAPASQSGSAAPPALPYSYLGRLEDGGQTRIFLNEGTTTWVVTAGKPVSGGWQLVSVEPGLLEFSYEPMGQRQTLRIGTN